MSLLEQLKKKPPHIKERYALAAAVFVTLLVGTFWVVSLPAKFAGNSSEGEAVDAERDTGLTHLFDSTKAQLGAVLESFENTAPEPEHTTTTEEAPAQAPAATSTAATTTSEARANDPTSTSSPEVRSRTVLIATTSSERGEQETE